MSIYSKLSIINHVLGALLKQGSVTDDATFQYGKFDSRLDSRRIGLDSELFKFLRKSDNIDHVNFSMNDAHGRRFLEVEMSCSRTIDLKSAGVVLLRGIMNFLEDLLHCDDVELSYAIEPFAATSRGIDITETHFFDAAKKHFKECHEIDDIVIKTYRIKIQNGMGRVDVGVGNLPDERLAFCILEFPVVPVPPQKKREAVSPPPSPKKHCSGGAGRGCGWKRPGCENGCVCQSRDPRLVRSPPEVSLKELLKRFSLRNKLRLFKQRLLHSPKQRLHKCHFFIVCGILQCIYIRVRLCIYRNFSSYRASSH
jgi:hypothetical protein